MIGIFALFGLVLTGSTYKTALNLGSAFPRRSGSSSHPHPPSESPEGQTPQRGPSARLSEFTLSVNDSY